MVDETTSSDRHHALRIRAWDRKRKAHHRRRRYAVECPDQLDMKGNTKVHRRKDTGRDQRSADETTWGGTYSRTR
jgi:hypothetical protein